MRWIVGLLLFFLAAAFEGSILYYVFGGLGFLVLSGALLGSARHSSASSPSSVSSTGSKPIIPQSSISDPDPNPVEGPDTSFSYPQPLGEDGNKETPLSSRKFLLGCLGAVTFATAAAFIFAILAQMRNPRDEEQLIEEHARWVPEYWDQTSCLESRFPQLITGPQFFPPEITQHPGWQRGEYAAGVYCAYDWDIAEVARQVEVLRRNGLLVSQWNPEAIEQARNAFRLQYPGADLLNATSDLHDLADDPHFANVSRLLEGVAMAAVETDLPLPAPSAQKRAEARVNLPINAPVPLRSKPRRIVIRNAAPAIHLYTDMPDEMTLADLGSENQIVTGGSFAVFHLRMDELRGDGLPTLATAPDLFNRHLLGQLSAIVTVALRQRDHQLEDLKDLNIFYLKQPPPPEIRGGSVNRTALYRRDLGTIYVQRPSSISYRSGVDTIMSVIAADLLHELDHYFHDEPHQVQLPFLQEGQATFNGERGMRPILSGGRASDELSLPEVLEMFKLPVDKFAEFAEERISQERMGSNERLILCRASRLARLGRVSMEKALTISPERLARMGDDFHRDFYSVAWASYGALRQDDDWPEDLKELARRIMEGDRIHESLSAELALLDERVTNWIYDAEETEDLICPS